MRPLLLVALTTCLSAQSRVHGQALVTVTTAAAGETINGMRNFQNCVAAMRNGPLFALVKRTAKATPTRSLLELWRSDDGSNGWRLATTAPFPNARDGALVVDGDLLACVASADCGSAFSGVVFQRFDPAKGEWLGEATPLASGRSDDDQYFCYDLVRTVGGTLVTSIGSHRSPPQPTWRDGWSNGLRCLPAGAATWTPLQQVNVGYSGVAANLAVRGDVVDVTYRTIVSGALHGLRTYDAAHGTFEQEQDARATGPVDPDTTTNVGILCIDGSGGRTLLHALGASQPGRGRLAVSYARPGDEPVTVDIAEDAPLVSGNENPNQYCLARGPADQVFVYFSKVDEEYANLWQCVVERGKPVVAPRVVVAGAPHQFEMVSGLRASGVFSGLHVAVSGHPADHPGGVLAVFGSWPARTVWGR